MTRPPLMTPEIQRDLRARCYWTRGFVQDRLRLKDYEEYVASIPVLTYAPPPEEGIWHRILVDPRVDFEGICREELAGFSASSLNECRDEDGGQPRDRPYWILVKLIEQPRTQFIRGAIKAIPEGRRGCTLLEGFAIRIQEHAQVRDRQLVLPGSRFYGSPDDHYFRGALRQDGQFGPICTDASIDALIAVADKRIFT